MSPGLLPALLWSGRFIHFVGLGLAIGGASAAVIVFRQGLVRVAATIVSKVEIPGLFTAIVGGILLVIVQPEVLDPEKSGAGPWLFVKLPLVMAALVIAHMRAFNANRIARGREQNEPDRELDPLIARGKKLDYANLLAYLIILFVAVFRVMLFAG